MSNWDYRIRYDPVDDMCRVCDYRRAVHTHHRKLRSQGGDNQPANLLRVCLDCHEQIHRFPEASYGVGLLVHSWDDPSAVAVALDSTGPIYPAPHFIERAERQLERDA